MPKTNDPSTAPEKVVHFVHSCYRNDDQDDAVIVKEKHITKQPDGSTHIEDKLKLIPSPRRSFWMTKPGLRTHQFKKEHAPESELDQFTVPHRDMMIEIKKRLGLPLRTRANLRQLCDSPYLYGADIDIQVLIKQAYMRKEKKASFVPIFNYTVGGLDSEVSVLGCERIQALTFVHEDKIYCAVNDNFMYYYQGLENVAPELVTRFLEKEGRETTRRVKASLDDLKAVVNKYLAPYFAKYPQFKEIEYFITPNELELITWVFQKIHTEKTDFIGIWNIGFDIPKIIERIKANGGDVLAIMSHPDVPAKYRVAEFQEDKKNVDHFTDKWHWVHCSGYSQFVDQMNLYSRIRKTKGRESSYTLDTITTKELKDGKLKIGAESASHHFMQKFRFLEYIAYNIVDTILLVLLEKKNGDMTMLSRLVGTSLLSDFSKQTVMLKNMFYEYARDRGHVPATSGANMTTEFDKLMSKIGGTVLPSEMALNVGLQALQEYPGFETLVSAFVSDIDVGSMYPNTTAGFGISKETKMATAVSVGGFGPAGIEPLFSRITTPHENAVMIGHTYLGLPNYEEFALLFDEFQNSQARMQ